MKLPRGVLLAPGVLAFVHLAFAVAAGNGDGRSSAARDALSRFADATEVGIAEVHPVTPEDEEVGADLIGELEADGQTTGEAACLTYRGRHVWQHAAKQDHRSYYAAKFNFRLTGFSFKKKCPV